MNIQQDKVCTVTLKIMVADSSHDIFSIRRAPDENNSKLTICDFVVFSCFRLVLHSAKVNKVVNLLCFRLALHSAKTQYWTNWPPYKMEH
jgi:hypothetical protein